MMQRKWLMILLMLLLAFAAACGGTGDSAEGQPCSDVEVGETDGMADLQGCTLRVAVENAYQPFNFIDTDTGEAVGYDYGIFNEVCERINCEPEYIETSWDAMVAIMGGEGDFDTFDVGANGITITEERDQFVDFSTPYITSSQVLLVREDEDRFVEPDELSADSNLLIGTQLGTTNYDVAVELVGEDRIVAYDQFGTAVQSLINGEVDAVIIDNVAGQGYAGQNAESVKITGQAVSGEELGFIFSSNSPLREAVNEALAAMEADGEMEALYNTWFE